MVIAIDLTSLSYHMSGIERYASCITEKMLEQDKVNQYKLIFRNSVYPTFEKFIDGKRVQSFILHGNKKVLFLQVILPWNLYKIKADRYVFFAFTSPILFRRKGIVNTIHDMGAWDSSDSMTTLQKIYWRTTYKLSAGVSERIITVSHFSMERINKILKYPKERISVIYSAVSAELTKENDCTFQSVKKKYSLPDKYIMTLSTLEPRKNMELLLSAYADIQNVVDYDLVLVGRKGWKVDKLLEQYNTKKHIHITGFVDDRHISSVYKNAICFVFPSLYEGFGLPPVEALTFGLPVISSNAASMPEILMNQAVFFQSDNKNELKDILRNLEGQIDSMPHGLNVFQTRSYNFETSAKKVISLLENI